MAKGQDSHRLSKKKPAKSMKEKRNEKRAKRAKAHQQDII